MDAYRAPAAAGIFIRRMKLRSAVHVLDGMTSDAPRPRAMPTRTVRSIRPLAALLLAAAFPAAACAQTGTQPPAQPAAVAAAMDPALALATFDSAWSRIHHSYYDSTFKGTSWTAVRDELRPRVQAARTEA